MKLLKKIVKFIFKKLFLKEFLVVWKKSETNNGILKIFDLPNFTNCYSTTVLCLIMKKYGSDKALFSGNGRHNYTPVYHRLFKKIQDNNIRIFEIGIGTNNINIPSNMGENGKPGASLRGWKEYFKNGKVYGADIDKNILFKEDRITTFYCDQLDPDAISNMWESNIELKDKMDIIIDDGLHTFEANTIFFENSIYKIKRGGYYIIEDIQKGDLDLWISYLKNLNLINTIKYWIAKIPNNQNQTDNTLIIIKVTQ